LGGKKKRREREVNGLLLLFNIPPGRGKGRGEIREHSICADDRRVKRKGERERIGPTTPLTFHSKKKRREKKRSMSFPAEREEKRG